MYGWRADGPGTWVEGGRFHPGFIMLDPYARRALPVMLPRAAYECAPMLPPEGGVAGPSLLGALGHLVEAFDWQGVRRPAVPLDSTALLELDVAAFTTGGTGAWGLWLWGTERVCGREGGRCRCVLGRQAGRGTVCVYVC